MEAKRIQDKGEFVVFMEQKVLPLYLRFQCCDYEAKDGAIEYCWHLIRKQIAYLCSLKDIYKPRKH
jgi:DNA-binding transcriptional regulator PaaX